MKIERLLKIAGIQIKDGQIAKADLEKAKSILKRKALASPQEELTREEIIEDILSHTSNMGYNDETNKFEDQQYFRKDLQKKSDQELIDIYEDMTTNVGLYKIVEGSTKLPKAFFEGNTVDESEVIKAIKEAKQRIDDAEFETAFNEAYTKEGINVLYQGEGKYTVVKADVETATLSNKEFAAQIEEIVRSHFPNSFVAMDIRGALGSTDVCLRFAYGKDRSEWSYGIINNDPLHTVIMFRDFDKDGMLIGDKVKVKMLIGGRSIDFKSKDPERPHLARSIRHGWKNFTAKPATALTKVDQYFGNIEAWSKTEEGQRLCGEGKTERGRADSATADLNEAELRDIEYARKPGSWEEAKKSSRDLSDLQLELLQSASKELEHFNSDGKGPMDSFESGRPDYFVVDHKGDEFLVNTSGYDYCRYVAYIPKEDSTASASNAPRGFESMEEFANTIEEMDLSAEDPTAFHKIIDQYLPHDERMTIKDMVLEMSVGRAQDMLDKLLTLCYHDNGETEATASSDKILYAKEYKREDFDELLRLKGTQSYIARKGDEWFLLNANMIVVDIAKDKEAIKNCYKAYKGGASQSTFLVSRILDMNKGRCSPEEAKELADLRKKKKPSDD